MIRKAILTAWSMGVMVGGVWGEEEMAKGAAPEEAVKRMRVPEGFAVDLVAAEPEVVQPIAMAFDERGRLWVAEGLTYPQRAPEGQGKDRLVIFEDGDGDGKWETRKVFAEGLNLVSGFEIGHGGVFVGAAPYLLFLEDRDRDDRPDGEAKVLLDGWGYQDTHETLNSFIWGPDGWLWGCHGVFTHSRVGKPGTPDEKRVPINAGVWRYHPGDGRFEVVAHGTSNPWGLDFNDWGDAFVEACVIPHLWHIIPGGYYQRQAGAHFNPHVYEVLETIADHLHWKGDLKDHAHWGHENAIPQAVSDAGGGHAHSGFAICLSEAFPESFRNQAFFFNIHGHRINRDVLERRGSGWVGRHAPDLMLARDEWFVGVSLRPGPDGAIYFCDWHDATSCHRTDPLRWNRENGRVYRLRYGKARSWKGDVAKWTDEELAKAQMEGTEWELRMARRVLHERFLKGEKLSGEAKKILENGISPKTETTRRLRAMWAMRVSGECTEPLLHRLSGDEDPEVRAWAVRIWAEEGLESKVLADLAAKEDSPRVQLALASALPRMSGEAAMTTAAALAPRVAAEDPNLMRMLWFGIEGRVEEHLEAALKMGSGTKDGRMIGWICRRVEREESVARILSAMWEHPRRGDWVRGLEKRWEARPQEALSEGAMKAIEDRAAAGDEVAARWLERRGGAAAAAQLWKKALDGSLPMEERREAIRWLGRNPEAGEGGWQALLEVAALRADVLEAKPALLDRDEVEAVISSMDAAEKSRVARLAAREAKWERMMRWMETGRLRSREVPADVVARWREAAKPEWKEKIEEWWGPVRSQPEEKRKEIEEWKKKLTPEVLGKADPAAGGKVFEKTCAACHQFFGKGGKIGPELTGGDRGSLDHWLDHILDPNAIIGEGYALYQVTKKDGSEVTGMLSQKLEKEWVIQMVGHETRIPVDEIETSRALGMSMMPEGLLRGLSEEEVRDLIGFLMKAEAP